MAKPVASKKTTTLLLPRALIEGVAWDHSRWNKAATVGVERLSQQLKSSSFQFMSTCNIQFRVS